MTDAGQVLELLLQAARLKWVPRSGWLMRGVPDPESVAEHSWGTAFLALVLSASVDEPLDRGKLLTIALLHDLPEAVLSDVPTPATPYFPPAAKREAEGRVLADLFAGLPGDEPWLACWEEFEAGSTPEGRLVQDVDRLEMLLQAYLYETNRGSRLAEFWQGQSQRSFHFAVSQAVYCALCERRAAALAGAG